MASKAHQFIADLVARRMSIDGYEVVSFEGYSETEKKIALPPAIKRHRPDLLGIKKGSLAIGEAKTAVDFGVRTHEQIEDYVSSQGNVLKANLKIYFGVPASVEKQTKELISNVSGNKAVVLLTIPDRLLPQ